MALFDIIFQENHQNHDEISSIQKHLQRLFNTRKGSLKHMPDYGLPDMTEIYRCLPYSINHLLHAIQISIETYEPRLQQVNIIHTNIYELNCILSLKINARLHRENLICFNTYFRSEGSVNISVE